MKKNKQQAFEKAHTEYEAWENSLEGVALPTGCGICLFQRP
jgi:hypothetical protein